MPTESSNDDGGAKTPPLIDPNTLSNVAIATALEQIAAQATNPQLKTILLQAAGRVKIHWSTYGGMQMVLDEQEGKLGKRARRIIGNWLKRHGQ